MRILITVGLFPPDVGGPATYVPAIAKALALRGHRVVVVAPQDRAAPCPVADPPYRLVRFYRASFLRYANFVLELWRAFAATLREARGCDVIYCNGLGLPTAWVSRLVRRPMVVKVVGDESWELAYNRGWTDRYLEKFQQTRGCRIGFIRLLHHLAARWAKTVIVPSHYLARIVKGWGVSAGRMCVIYNAFVAPVTTNDDLPDVPLPARFHEGLRLITVGRLVPLKRTADVILVIARMEDVRLIVVGDGPQAQYLEALVGEQALTDRVLLLGRLSQDRVWSLLARYADVLILNSIHESLPHVILEAAYLGVPVVATAVGGIPELLEDEKTGLLISPDSPDGLLTALRRLQGDSALRLRLSRNARCSVERFGFERMVEQTEHVLEAAAARRVP